MNDKELKKIGIRARVKCDLFYDRMNCMHEDIIALIRDNRRLKTSLNRARKTATELRRRL